MRPTDLFKRVTGQVLFVDPLHNHHVGARLRVVEAGGHGFVPPSQCRLANRRRFCFSHIVRVVDDDDVPTLARQRAVNGRGQPVSALVILEAYLGVLVRRELEPFPPCPLIGRAFDEPPAFHAVSDRQGLRIGSEKELSAGP